MASNLLLIDRSKRLNDGLEGEGMMKGWMGGKCLLTLPISPPCRRHFSNRSGEVTVRRRAHPPATVGPSRPSHEQEGKKGALLLVGCNL